MSDRILVAYATRYGSTREVAEAVAEVLRDRRYEVDVQSVGKVGTVDGYRAVVIGAPFYIGSWLKETNAFLTTHRAALATCPVAVFALGPLGSGEEEMVEARKQLDAELAKNPWLKPVAAEMFGGKYDPARLRFLDKLLAALPASPLYKLSASDVRDWTAIRAWAGDVAGKLQPLARQ